MSRGQREVGAVMADMADQLYAQQQVMLQQLADLRGDVKGLQAEVAAQLGHGSRKMDDHEVRLRTVEQALPDAAESRLAALEAAAQVRHGRVSVLALIGSILGSSTVGAMITLLITSYLHHR